MANLFISDTHWFHENILEYDQRPFASMGIMLDKMMHYWNNAVKPSDTVYHIGDVALTVGGKEIYVEHVSFIMEHLNGRKVLIKGNHDRSTALMYDCGFAEVYRELYLPIPELLGSKPAYLIHNPWSRAVQLAEKAARLTHLAGKASKAVQDQGNRYPLVKPPAADVVIHGHIHNKGWHRLYENDRLYLNAGCMRNNYRPVTLEELIGVPNELPDDVSEANQTQRSHRQLRRQALDAE